MPSRSYTNQFDGSYIEYATLHVPSAVINDFKATEPWCNFGKIVPIDDEEIPQCEAPTISYQGGELEFACTTAKGYSRSETVEYQLPINPGLRGDINQDGKVTVADATEVANIILEKKGE